MMRMMLYEAAQSMLVRSAKWSWLKAWAMKIARHRGMKKAIVALVPRGLAAVDLKSSAAADRYCAISKCRNSSRSSDRLSAEMSH
jgi:hypothetical protein